jgi:hypothetical protein
MSRSEEAKLMKRLMDAVNGRPLSWSLTHDIKRITGHQYSGGEKLCSICRKQVQAEIDGMAARGVQPAKTLLSKCQQQALRRRA